MAYCYGNITDNTCLDAAIGQSTLMVFMPNITLVERTINLNDPTFRRRHIAINPHSIMGPTGPEGARFNIYLDPNTDWPGEDCSSSYHTYCDHASDVCCNSVHPDCSDQEDTTLGMLWGSYVKDNGVWLPEYNNNIQSCDSGCGTLFPTPRGDGTDGHYPSDYACSLGGPLNWGHRLANTPPDFPATSSWYAQFQIQVPMPKCRGDAGKHNSYKFYFSIQFPHPITGDIIEAFAQRRDFDVTGYQCNDGVSDASGCEWYGDECGADSFCEPIFGDTFIGTSDKLFYPYGPSNPNVYNDWWSGDGGNWETDDDDGICFCHLTECKSAAEGGNPSALNQYFIFNPNSDGENYSRNIFYGMNQEQWTNNVFAIKNFSENDTPYHFDQAGFNNLGWDPDAGGGLTFVYDIVRDIGCTDTNAASTGFDKPCNYHTNTSDCNTKGWKLYDDNPANAATVIESCTGGDCYQDNCESDGNVWHGGTCFDATDLGNYEDPLGNAGLRIDETENCCCAYQVCTDANAINNYCFWKQFTGDWQNGSEQTHDAIPVHRLQNVDITTDLNPYDFSVPNGNDPTNWHDIKVTNENFSFTHWDAANGYNEDLCPNGLGDLPDNISGGGTCNFKEKQLGCSSLTALNYWCNDTTGSIPYSIDDSICDDESCGGFGDNCGQCPPEFVVPTNNGGFVDFEGLAAHCDDTFDNTLCNTTCEWPFSFTISDNEAAWNSWGSDNNAPFIDNVTADFGFSPGDPAYGYIGGNGKIPITLDNSQPVKSLKVQIGPVHDCLNPSDGNCPHVGGLYLVHDDPKNVNGDGLYNGDYVIDPTGLGTNIICDDSDATNYHACTGIFIDKETPTTDFNFKITCIDCETENGKYEIYAEKNSDAIPAQTVSFKCDPNGSNSGVDCNVADPSSTCPGECTCTETLDTRRIFSIMYDNGNTKDGDSNIETLNDCMAMGGKWEGGENCLYSRQLFNGENITISFNDIIYDDDSRADQCDGSSCVTSTGYSMSITIPANYIHCAGHPFANSENNIGSTGGPTQALLDPCGVCGGDNELINDGASSTCSGTHLSEENCCTCFAADNWRSGNSGVMCDGNCSPDTWLGDVDRKNWTQKWADDCFWAFCNSTYGAPEGDHTFQDGTILDCQDFCLDDECVTATGNPKCHNSTQCIDNGYKDGVQPYTTDTAAAAYGETYDCQCNCAGRYQNWGKRVDDCQICGSDNYSSELNYCYDDASGDIIRDATIPVGCDTPAAVCDASNSHNGTNYPGSTCTNHSTRCFCYSAACWSSITGDPETGNCEIWLQSTSCEDAGGYNITTSNFITGTYTDCYGQCYQNTSDGGYYDGNNIPGWLGSPAGEALENACGMCVGGNTNFPLTDISSYTGEHNLLDLSKNANGISLPYYVYQNMIAIDDSSDLSALRIDEINHNVPFTDGTESAFGTEYYIIVEHGYCEGNLETDCAGECGGNAKLDTCNVCIPNNQDVATSTDSCGRCPNYSRYACGDGYSNEECKSGPCTNCCGTGDAYDCEHKGWDPSGLQIVNDEWSWDTYNTCTGCMDAYANNYNKRSDASAVLCYNPGDSTGDTVGTNVCTHDGANCSYDTIGNVNLALQTPNNNIGAHASDIGKIHWGNSYDIVWDALATGINDNVDIKLTLSDGTFVKDIATNQTDGVSYPWTTTDSNSCGSTCGAGSDTCCPTGNLKILIQKTGNSNINGSSGNKLGTATTYGCTDSTPAGNYNSAANVDSGLCKYYGCLDQCSPDYVGGSDNYDYGCNDCSYVTPVIASLDITSPSLNPSYIDPTNEITLTLDLTDIDGDGGIDTTDGWCNQSNSVTWTLEDSGGNPKTINKDVTNPRVATIAASHLDKANSPYTATAVVSNTANENFSPANEGGNDSNWDSPLTCDYSTSVATDSETYTININTQPYVDTFTVSPSSPREDHGTVTLTASASDTDTDGLTYSFVVSNEGDGPSGVSLSQDGSGTATFSTNTINVALDDPAAARTFRVTVTANDGQENSSNSPDYDIKINPYETGCMQSGAESPIALLTYCNTASYPDNTCEDDGSCTFTPYAHNTANIGMTGDSAEPQEYITFNATGAKPWPNDYNSAPSDYGGSYGSVSISSICYSIDINESGSPIYSPSADGGVTCDTGAGAETDPTNNHSYQVQNTDNTIKIGYTITNSDGNTDTFTPGTYQIEVGVLKACTDDGAHNTATWSNQVCDGLDDDSDGVIDGPECVLGQSGDNCCCYWPSSSTTLTATTDEVNQITLNWSAPTTTTNGNSIAGNISGNIRYTVYADDGGGGGYSPLVIIADGSTSYVHTGLGYGVDITYYVTAEYQTNDGYGWTGPSAGSSPVVGSTLDDRDPIIQNTSYTENVIGSGVSDDTITSEAYDPDGYALDSFVLYLGATPQAYGTDVGSDGDLDISYTFAADTDNTHSFPDQAKKTYSFSLLATDTNSSIAEESDIDINAYPVGCTLSTATNYNSDAWDGTQLGTPLSTTCNVDGTANDCCLFTPATPTAVYSTSNCPGDRTQVYGSCSYSIDLSWTAVNPFASGSYYKIYWSSDGFTSHDALLTTTNTNSLAINASHSNYYNKSISFKVSYYNESIDTESSKSSASSAVTVDGEPINACNTANACNIHPNCSDANYECYDIANCNHPSCAFTEYGADGCDGNDTSADHYNSCGICVGPDTPYSIIESPPGTNLGTHPTYTIDIATSDSDNTIVVTHLDHGMNCGGVCDASTPIALDKVADGTCSNGDGWNPDGTGCVVSPNTMCSADIDYASYPTTYAFDLLCDDNTSHYECLGGAADSTTCGPAGGYLCRTNTYRSFNTCGIDKCGVCGGTSSYGLTEAEYDKCPDPSDTDWNNCSSAPSYNPVGSVDCSGQCFGGLTTDLCGLCNGPNTSGTPADPHKDCHLDCWGGATLDVCTECSGGNTGTTPNNCAVSVIEADGQVYCTNVDTSSGNAAGFDCYGVCNGDSVIDDCNLCACSSGLCGPTTPIDYSNSQTVVNSISTCVSALVDSNVDDIFGNDLYTKGTADGNFDECCICSTDSTIYGTGDTTPWDSSSVIIDGAGWTHLCDDGIDNQTCHDAAAGDATYTCDNCCNSSANNCRPNPYYSSALSFSYAGNSWDTNNICFGPHIVHIAHNNVVSDEQDCLDIGGTWSNPDCTYTTGSFLYNEITSCLSNSSGPNIGICDCNAAPCGFDDPDYPSLCGFEDACLKCHTAGTGGITVNECDGTYTIESITIGDGLPLETGNETFYHCDTSPYGQNMDFCNVCHTFGTTDTWGTSAPYQGTNQTESQYWNRTCKVFVNFGNITLNDDGSGTGNIEIKINNNSFLNKTIGDIRLEFGTTNITMNGVIDTSLLMTANPWGSNYSISQSSNQIDLTGGTIGDTAGEVLLLKIEFEMLSSGRAEFEIDDSNSFIQDSATNQYPDTARDFPAETKIVRFGCTDEKMKTCTGICGVEGSDANDGECFTAANYGLPYITPPAGTPEVAIGCYDPASTEDGSCAYPTFEITEIDWNSDIYDTVCGGDNSCLEKLADGTVILNPLLTDIPNGFYYIPQNSVEFNFSITDVGLVDDSYKSLKKVVSYEGNPEDSLTQVLAWGSTSDNDIFNSGGGYTWLDTSSNPLDGTYTITLTWPSSGDAIINTYAWFTTKKSGCTNDSYTGCDGSYNENATHDCNGDLGGTDYSCCNGIDVMGYCCGHDDQHGGCAGVDCGICNLGSTHPDGNTYNCEEWYFDQDGDHIGCSTTKQTVCPTYTHPNTGVSPGADWYHEDDIYWDDDGSGVAPAVATPPGEATFACFCADPLISDPYCPTPTHTHQGLCVTGDTDNNSSVQHCNLCNDEHSPGLASTPDNWYCPEPDSDGVYHGDISTPKMFYNTQADCQTDGTGAPGHHICDGISHNCVNGWPLLGIGDSGSIKFNATGNGTITFSNSKDCHGTCFASRTGVFNEVGNNWDKNDGLSARPLFGAYNLCGMCIYGETGNVYSDAKDVCDNCQGTPSFEAQGKYYCPAYFCYDDPTTGYQLIEECHAATNSCNLGGSQCELDTTNSGIFTFYGEYYEDECNQACQDAAKLECENSGTNACSVGGIDCKVYFDCLGCDGEPGSPPAQYDSCGVCGGTAVITYTGAISGLATWESGAGSWCNFDETTMDTQYLVCDNDGSPCTTQTTDSAECGGLGFNCIINPNWQSSNGLKCDCTCVSDGSDSRFDNISFINNTFDSTGCCSASSMISVYPDLDIFDATDAPTYDETTYGDNITPTGEEFFENGTPVPTLTVCPDRSIPILMDSISAEGGICFSIDGSDPFTGLNPSSVTKAVCDIIETNIWCSYPNDGSGNTGCPYYTNIDSCYGVVDLCSRCWPITLNSSECSQGPNWVNGICLDDLNQNMDCAAVPGVYDDDGNPGGTNSCGTVPENYKLVDTTPPIGSNRIDFCGSCLPMAFDADGGCHECPWECPTDLGNTFDTEGECESGTTCGYEECVSTQCYYQSWDSVGALNPCKYPDSDGIYYKPLSGWNTGCVGCMDSDSTTCRSVCDSGGTGSINDLTYVVDCNTCNGGVCSSGECSDYGNSCIQKYPDNCYDSVAIGNGDISIPCHGELDNIDDSFENYCCDYEIKDLNTNRFGITPYVIEGGPPEVHGIVLVDTFVEETKVMLQWYYLGNPYDGATFEIYRNNNHYCYDSTNSQVVAGPIECDGIDDIVTCQDEDPLYYCDYTYAGSLDVYDDKGWHCSASGPVTANTYTCDPTSGGDDYCVGLDGGSLCTQSGLYSFVDDWNQVTDEVPNSDTYVSYYVKVIPPVRDIFESGYLGYTCSSSGQICNPNSLKNPYPCTLGETCDYNDDNAVFIDWRLPTFYFKSPVDVELGIEDSDYEIINDLDGVDRIYCLPRSNCRFSSIDSVSVGIKWDGIPAMLYNQGGNYDNLGLNLSRRPATAAGDVWTPTQNEFDAWPDTAILEENSFNVTSGEMSFTLNEIDDPTRFAVITPSGDGGNYDTNYRQFEIYIEYPPGVTDFNIGLPIVIEVEAVQGCIKSDLTCDCNSCFHLCSACADAEGEPGELITPEACYQIFDLTDAGHPGYWKGFYNPSASYDYCYDENDQLNPGEACIDDSTCDCSFSCSKILYGCLDKGNFTSDDWYVSNQIDRDLSLCTEPSDNAGEPCFVDGIIHPNNYQCGGLASILEYCDVQYVVGSVMNYINPDNTYDVWNDNMFGDSWIGTDPYETYYTENYNYDSSGDGNDDFFLGKTATNYNKDSDGNDLNPVYGINVTTDDESCIYAGCTDPGAVNYDGPNSYDADWGNIVDCSTLPNFEANRDTICGNGENNTLCNCCVFPFNINLIYQTVHSDSDINEEDGIISAPYETSCQSIDDTGCESGTIDELGGHVTNYDMVDLDGSHVQPSSGTKQDGGYHLYVRKSIDAGESSDKKYLLITLAGDGDGSVYAYYPHNDTNAHFKVNEALSSVSITLNNESLIEDTHYYLNDEGCTSGSAELCYLIIPIDFYNSNTTSTDDLVVTINFVNPDDPGVTLQKQLHTKLIRNDYLSSFALTEGASEDFEFDLSGETYTDTYQYTVYDIDSDNYNMSVTWSDSPSPAEQIDLDIGASVVGSTAGTNHNMTITILNEDPGFLGSWEITVTGTQEMSENTPGVGWFYDTSGNKIPFYPVECPSYDGCQDYINGNLTQTEQFNLSVLNTQGPVGYLVPNLVSSFGISPDSYEFKIFGLDERTVLEYDCYTANGGDCTNDNMGGWLTKNTYNEETNPYGNLSDTVWKYELFIKGPAPDGFDYENESWENLDDPDAGGDESYRIFYRYWSDWDWNHMGDGLDNYIPAEDQIESNNNAFWIPTYCGFNYDNIANCYPQGPCPGENCKPGSIRNFIENGVEYRFNERGDYRVYVKAYDLNYNNDDGATGTKAGETFVDLNVAWVIPIEQSIDDYYLPWQGINIPSRNIEGGGWTCNTVDGSGTIDCQDAYDYYTDVIGGSESCGTKFGNYGCVEVSTDYCTGEYSCSNFGTIQSCTDVESVIEGQCTWYDGICTAGHTCTTFETSPSCTSVGDTCGDDGEGECISLLNSPCNITYCTCATPDDGCTDSGGAWTGLETDEATCISHGGDWNDPPISLSCGNGGACDVSVPGQCVGNDLDCDEYYTETDTCLGGCTFENVLTCEGDFNCVTYHADSYCKNCDYTCIGSDWININQQNPNLCIVGSSLDPLTIEMYESEKVIKSIDKDKRPSLGLFTYTEDNNTGLNWDIIVDEYYDKKSEYGRSVYNPVTDFKPDVDARTKESKAGTYSTIFKYYDKEITPIEYSENTAPTEIQLYFYSRQSYVCKLPDYSNISYEYLNLFDNQCSELNIGSTCGEGENLGICEKAGLFHKSSPIEFNNLPDEGMYIDKFYVSFIDWGDGSLVEYDKEAFKLGNDSIVSHIYEKSGIYKITGYMMSVGDGGNWSEVIPEVNYLPDTNCSNECERLGYGCGDYECEVFNFYNYPEIENSNEMGDIQEGLIYFDDIHTAVNGTNACNNPFPEDDDSSFSKFFCCCSYKGVNNFKKFTLNINLSRDPDKEDEFSRLGGGEYTYLPIDETRPSIGGISEYSIYYKTIQRQLGYIPGGKIETEWPNYNDRLNAEYALANADSNFIGNEISKFTGSLAVDVFDVADEYPISVYGTENTLQANVASGFYSGSVDEFGDLDEYETIYLINSGLYKKHGELGHHLGNVDVGQTRFYYDGGPSHAMYRQLGFDDSDAGNPTSPIYWNNIIPESYNEFTSRNDDDGQTWQTTDDGQTPYYPVLPLINDVGLFDESLGLQGPGNIPFGGKINWDDIDTESPATNKNYSNSNLLLDISSKGGENDTTKDESGNLNVGIMIGDYRVNYDDQSQPVKQDPPKITRINSDNKPY